jgi:small conductance mechanosensitive channel
MEGGSGDGTIAPLVDVSRWARGDLLVIVLLLLGAILLTRMADWLRERSSRTRRPARSVSWCARKTPPGHRAGVTWGAGGHHVVTAVLIVRRLGVPSWPGRVNRPAQRRPGFQPAAIRQDIGAGFFITGERQYGFGDVVTIATAGVTQPVTGTVEDVTLRVTRLRTVSGEVITTPNGQIIQVTNLSRDWARAVIDVPVPAAVDVSHVTDVLRRVGEEAYSDDRLRKMLLDPPTVMGVEKIEVDTFSVRMVARTLPGIQFEVGRELRARVASAFRREGIIVAAELETGRATGGAS